MNQQPTQPIQQMTPSPQKSGTMKWLLVILIIVIILGGGYLLWAKYGGGTSSTATTSPTPTATISTSSIPTASGGTAQVYKNTEYGFQFTLPSGITYESVASPFGVPQGSVGKRVSVKQSGSEIFVLDTPIPEIGYEDSTRLSENQISVTGSDKKLTKQTYKNADGKYMILVFWNMDTFAKSGEITMIYTSQDDAVVETLTQILSTFQFTQ